MKILQLSLFFSILTLLANCVSHRAPVDDKQFWKDKDLESAYRDALTDPQKACSVFVSLSRHSDFLLKEESLYHALQKCSKDELKQFNFNLAENAEKASANTEVLKENKKLESYFETETLKKYALYLRFAKLDKSYLSNTQVLTGEAGNAQALSRTDAELVTTETLTLEDIERLSSLFNEKSKKLDYYKRFISYCGTDEYCSSQVKNRIYSLNPIEDPNLPRQNPLLYADQLRDTRQYNKALSLYKDELKREKNPENKARVYKKIMHTYRLQGRKDLLLKSANEYYNSSKLGFLKNKKSDVYRTLYIDASLTVARRFWTESQPERGEQILNEAYGFLNANGGSAGSEELLFILAKIAENQNMDAKALFSYAQLLNQINRSNPALQIDLKSDATTFKNRMLEIANSYKEMNPQHMKYFWSLSWFFIKKSEWPIAASLLKILVAATPESSDQFKFMFWLGYAYDKLGENKEADSQFKTLFERDIFGYYGVLAGYKLKTPLKTIQPSNKKLFESSWPVEIKKLALLAYVGDDILFPIYLIDLKNKFNQLEYAYLFHIFNAFNRSYLPLFAYTAQSSFEEKQKLLSNDSALLYPLDYLEIVEAQARQQEFSKEFALSIIRQESAFHPRARSGSDALGLMQLLPSTARKNIQRLKLKLNFEPEHLYQPELNIQLGISELKNLFDRSQQSFIYAAAAYNAGEIPIKKWLKERQTNDSLIFIEDIPYEETRTYVKLAIRNYTFYKRMLESADFTVNDDIFRIPLTE